MTRSSFSLFGLLVVGAGALTQVLGCSGSRDASDTDDLAGDVAQSEGAVKSSGWRITGRNSMNDRERNACGIEYNSGGREGVGSDNLPIVGIDNINYWSYLGTKGRFEYKDKETSPVCGQIVELRFEDGNTQKFVVADRIWENSDHDQLDVARWYFEDGKGPMRGHNPKGNVSVTFTWQRAKGLKCASWVMQKADGDPSKTKYFNEHCDKNLSK